MGFETPESSWIEFAKEKNANLQFDPCLKVTSDSCWTMSREAEFDVNFIWRVDVTRVANLKLNTRTDFCFFLNVDNNSTFKMYANDFLTQVALIFNSQKIKIDDSELDRDFVFISNDEELVKSFQKAIKEFNLQKSKIDFIVEIEGKKNGVEGRRLIIQVNKLLKEKEVIEMFFNLGIKMQKIINMKI